MKRIIAPPHAVLVTGLVALLLSSPSASIAATYRFTKIAHTGDFLSNFREAPAVNDSAMVTFFAEPTVGDVGCCLFIGDGGQLSTVTCERTLGGHLGAIPSIDHEGTVAFVLSSKTVGLRFRSSWWALVSQRFSLQKQMSPTGFEDLE